MIYLGIYAIYNYIIYSLLVLYFPIYDIVHIKTKASIKSHVLLCMDYVHN